MAINILKKNWNVKLAFLWMLFASVACSDKKPKFPISNDKLYKVLADIQMVEATMDNETQTMKDSLSRLYYPQVFEHNGITSSDFDSCMRILSDDPYLMRDVYKEVVKEIQKHQPNETNQNNNNNNDSNKPK